MIVQMCIVLQMEAFHGRRRLVGCVVQQFLRQCSATSIDTAATTRRAIGAHRFCCVTLFRHGPVARAAGAFANPDRFRQDSDNYSDNNYSIGAPAILFNSPGALAATADLRARALVRAGERCKTYTAGVAFHALRTSCSPIRWFTRWLP